MEDFQVYLKEKTNFFETELKKELKELSYPETITKGMEYAILNGGKRLRPFLLFATLELLNEDIKKGVKSAIALEMIHSYSLIASSKLSSPLSNDSIILSKFSKFSSKVFFPILTPFI